MSEKYITLDENHYFNENYSFEFERNLPKATVLKENLGSFLGKNILEVGVAYGFLSSILLGEGCILTGTELDKNIAKRTSKKFNFKVYNYDVMEDIPLANNEFDAVIALEVIEHLGKPNNFFANARRLLKNNAFLLISTPNYRLGYKLRKLPLIGLPDTNPTHIMIKSPKFWLELLIKNNFEILKMWYGEHLSHIKYIHKIDRFLRENWPKMLKSSILNPLMQSFCVLAKNKK